MVKSDSVHIEVVRALAEHSWVLGVDNLAKWQKKYAAVKRFGRLFGHKSADS